ncbi:MAG: glucuronate isomerase, partial [Tenericutes bacterium HGW-Tenericutes-8]
MKPFIHDDFLLPNSIAKSLYEKYAKDLPIIDYHCHLDPKAIYEDKKYNNLYEVWLEADHYKWRLMRAFGVTEDFITGNQPDELKFMKWAEVVPELIGNPLYHWTHFELSRYFNVNELLSLNTAPSIYKNVNKQLEHLTARKLIEMSHVETICTTDDPVDSLKWHDLLAKDSSFKTKVLPAFRPDKAINLELSWFRSWIDELSSVTQMDLTSFDSFKKALVNRIDYFHQRGCRLSDHALDVILYE